MRVQPLFLTSLYYFCEVPKQYENKQYIDACLDLDITQVTIQDLVFIRLLLNSSSQIHIYTSPVVWIGYLRVTYSFTNIYVLVRRSDFRCLKIMCLSFLSHSVHQKAQLTSQDSCQPLLSIVSLDNSRAG